MTIDNKLLEFLSEEAKKSPRLRMNYDMRTTMNDQSQRMLNAIEPGTELPIHRHKNTTETCIIIHGAAEELFYDDNGNITERIVMEPNTDCCGVNIPVGRWHKIISLKPGTVIFEAKDGPYEPLSQDDILTL
ncbi:MAG: WbuC family cupin fold metalloprotein [Muribaculaceae bacterium]|nr:WbuC family cupin fold metalloprotein [Paramuribaculum sp.]MDE6297625.1 WbuC family cupin fold metalloprotein [Muribaculaceae bacterium]